MYRTFFWIRFFSVLMTLFSYSGAARTQGILYRSCKLLYSTTMNMNGTGTALSVGESEPGQFSRGLAATGPLQQNETW